ncbi:YqhG family protein [Sporolactobacillus pectinivorans]|uniref:YqhG family protein n=1 Tax=Sporolactobacillus pectinivorans TaxID=1591408 RepID=UPI000C26BB43|nr:YqhG family protein [Sporolactobacillus pectinivorans]
MQQAEILDFLTRFFSTSGCTLLPAENRGQVKVKLSEEMDQLLMNRPFYWHYIKQTGGVPETATLLLRTDEKSEDGELIYFGSPRLHQIFEATKKLAPFVRMYQETGIHSSTALEPWLCINMKISEQCDLKRDRLFSAGLQLINGTLIEGFHEVLANLSLSPKAPDYCYTLSPLITVQSGIKRIEKLIETELQNEPTEWADEAGRRWNRDRMLLDSFYEQKEEKPETYYMEKEALKAQYQPHIAIHLINAGLFYLQSKSFLLGTSTAR